MDWRNMNLNSFFRAMNYTSSIFGGFYDYSAREPENPNTVIVKEEGRTHVYYKDPNSPEDIEVFNIAAVSSNV